MTRRQIDAAKEIRLWITTVGMPVALYVYLYFRMHPETKKKWQASIQGLKDYAERKKENGKTRKYQKVN